MTAVYAASRRRALAMAASAVMLGNASPFSGLRQEPDMAKPAQRRGLSTVLRIVSGEMQARDLHKRVPRSSVSHRL
jgi:hypothetical protein